MICGEMSSLSIAALPTVTNWRHGPSAVGRSSKLNTCQTPRSRKNREQAHPPKEELNEVRPDRRVRPRSLARSIRKGQAPLLQCRRIADLRRPHEEAVQEGRRQVEDEGLQHDQVAVEPGEAARQGIRLRQTPSL